MNCFRCGKPLRGRWQKKFCSLSCCSRTPKTEEGLRRIGDATRKRQLERPLRYWLGKKRLSMTGEKHYLWKKERDDLTERKRLRNSTEYSVWRKSVFERDNFTCVFCGIRSGQGRAVILNADHIKPFAFFPELRFALDNGRTLCKPCHLKTETHGRPRHQYESLL